MKNEWIYNWLRSSYDCDISIDICIQMILRARLLRVCASHYTIYTLFSPTIFSPMLHFEGMEIGRRVLRARRLFQRVLSVNFLSHRIIGHDLPS